MKAKLCCCVNCPFPEPVRLSQTNDAASLDQSHAVAAARAQEGPASYRRIHLLGACPFPQDVGVMSRLKPLAEARGCTVAQLALAWLHAQARRDRTPLLAGTCGPCNVLNLGL